MVEESDNESISAYYGTYDALRDFTSDGSSGNASSDDDAMSCDGDVPLEWRTEDVDFFQKVRLCFLF